MKDLAGKVAVVNGSASGLGLAMARAFADEEMMVVVADRRLDMAEESAADIRSKGGKAEAIEVDVTDRVSLTALADQVDERFGGAQLVVNNAGVLPLTPLLEPDENGWRFEMEVNVFGVIYGCQTFLPRMLRSGKDGHMVNTASIAGMMSGGGITQDNRVPEGDAGFPDAPLAMFGYTASKFAVVGLTEALSSELAGTRVGLSVLCPHAHLGGNLGENSTTQRPERFGGPSDPRELSRALGAAMGGRKSVLPPDPDAPTMVPRDPAELGRRVVSAVKQRQFYIFTHSTDRYEQQRRFARIMAGFDDADAFES